MFKKIFLILFLIFGMFLVKPLSVRGDEASDLQDKINEYTGKLLELAKSKDTLANQIKLLDSQAQLTVLQINQTENSIKKLESEIASLTVKIGELDIKLNQLSSIFIEQVNQNYKSQKKKLFFSILIFQNFNSFLEQYKYLSLVQKNSQDTLMNMETIRTTYDMQKAEKEKKQNELIDLQKKLDQQKKDLNNQKQSKSKLLEITKNDEIKYQNLLNEAKREYEAIQKILVGNGKETEVGSVNQGQKIASVIQGASCSSSGTHLHFMVKYGNTAQNPFLYLKSGINYRDESNGDMFNPSGSWNWPIRERVDFNQGYGLTWSIKHTWVGKIYSFHNGIDITSSDRDQNVYSTLNGTLFRGSISAGNCTLRYVRVQDKDNPNVSTLNLHVNYL